MSLEQEITDIIKGTEEVLDDSPSNEIVELALQEANTLLHATGESLIAICKEIENASTRKVLRRAFCRFNNVMRIFSEAAPSDAEAPGVMAAVGSLPSTPRFKEVLASQSTLAEAIDAYKTLVIRDLAVDLRRRKELLSSNNLRDSELLDRLLPRLPEPDEDVHKIIEDAVLEGDSTGTPRKRGLSEVVETDSTRIPKKKRSTIPALAAVNVDFGSGDSGVTSKKALMTRKLLRKGENDPRGLLTLVGSSSDALERTKRMELLKTAGYSFQTQGTSFSQQLIAATLRLDVGLGGHVHGDTLTYGANVLSTPGVLTKKNLSDIQNNVSSGKTTWRHQNMYAMMMMMVAGCLNQATRILSKFDEVLFGQSPEILIESTHKKVRELLVSEEGRSFLKELEESDEVAVAKGDEFIKQLIGVVPPIIPIALRNDSLDGSYFRTALQFLGATELMLSQYEADIRRQANPAGLVGMCNAMHAGFERSVLFNEELKPLREFCRDMKIQYQTSLGLGRGFPNDSVARKFGRGNRRGRGTNYMRPSQLASRGLNREQHGADISVPQGNNTTSGRGAPLTQRYSPGQGICYGFQSGTCRRGNACRFLHIN